MNQAKISRAITRTIRFSLRCGPIIFAAFENG